MRADGERKIMRLLMLDCDNAVASAKRVSGPSPQYAVYQAWRMALSTSGTAGKHGVRLVAHQEERT